MNYTLAAAAKSVGMNTLLRVIKGSRTAGSPDEPDQCRVDAVETPPLVPAVTERRSDPGVTERDGGPYHAPWRAEVTARLALAEQRLADLKAMLEEMRTERDAWREQAQRLSLPKPTEASSTTSRWRWLRSTG
jgi:hypothetical protein